MGKCSKLKRSLMPSQGAKLHPMVPKSSTVAQPNMKRIKANKRTTPPSSPMHLVALATRIWSVFDVERSLRSLVALRIRSVRRLEVLNPSIRVRVRDLGNLGT